MCAHTICTEIVHFWAYLYNIIYLEVGMIHVHVITPIGQKLMLSGSKAFSGLY